MFFFELVLYFVFLIRFFSSIYMQNQIIICSYIYDENHGIRNFSNLCQSIQISRGDSCIRIYIQLICKSKPNQLPVTSKQMKLGRFNEINNKKIFHFFLDFIVHVYIKQLITYMESVLNTQNMIQKVRIAFTLAYSGQVHRTIIDLHSKILIS